jgi:hypothetical protein
MEATTVVSGGARDAELHVIHAAISVTVSVTSRYRPAAVFATAEKVI